MVGNGNMSESLKRLESIVSSRARPDKSLTFSLTRATGGQPAAYIHRKDGVVVGSINTTNIGIDIAEIEKFKVIIKHSE